MISATLATPGLLKIKVLWNKEYDVITYIHDLTEKLSCEGYGHVSFVTRLFL